MTRKTVTQETEQTLRAMAQELGVNMQHYHTAFKVILGENDCYIQWRDARGEWLSQGKNLSEAYADAVRIKGIWSSS